MANLYDLKRFDLNLLVIFECIYQHLSISKAAETLFITPSAVSQSLQRLRTQLNDPLFVRAGKGISPTTVAVNLHQHLAENLNQLEQTINMMNNSELEKKFIIYGPQFYFCEKVVNMMSTLLAEPDLQVEYCDFASVDESIENLLHYRKADIIFSSTQVNNRALVCNPFAEVPIALICRKDHPRLGDSATLEEIMNERFTFYDIQEPSVKQFHYASEGILAERKIAYRSPSLLSIINTIHHTELIGFFPRFIANYFKDSLNVREVTLPVPPASVTLYAIYNRSSLNSELFSRIIEKIEI